MPDYYECSECGWEFDEYKVEMRETEGDRHTLVEVKVCPECGELLDI